MIHFELGHIIVLKYAIISCRRFLQKKRKLYHFEKVILRFFSSISTSASIYYPQLFRELRTNLFSETEDNDRRTILDYLDFDYWIDQNLRHNQQ